MAILEFQRPDRVIMLEGSAYQGRFEFRPLEPGYGITIGNALRRILLSSLEGYAITSVKIAGVDHEFTTIPGVIEEVTQIVLNLKQVRFKVEDPDLLNETLTVTVSGVEEFTAGMINQFLTGAEVINVDHVICRMPDKANLELQLTIRKGRGYVPAEENNDPNAHFGVIAIDSIHTPIRNVMYKVDNYRVEQKTDYEKLTMLIDTDGSISPKDALKEAAMIMIEHLMLFSDEKISRQELPQSSVEEFSEEDQTMRQLLRRSIDDIGLSVRALNCLKAGEISTVADLVSKAKEELLKYRNFGVKSLSEIEVVLGKLGLGFSMDLSKYKLDKE